MASGNANDFLLPLHIAAFFDFDCFVQQELQNGAEVNQRTIECQTPLHLAARGDAVASGHLLITHGADVNAIGWSANTPLSWAIDVENYTTCTRSSPFLIAKKLLSCGADTTLVYDSLPPLNRACDMPMPDDPFLLDIVRLLLEKGAARQINGYHGHRPPLANADAQGALKLVNLLLSYGACPNARSEGNAFRQEVRSPLINALRGSQNKQVILALLERGADTNFAGPDGRTTLHVCIEECNEFQGLAELLLRFGADVNRQASDGSLALHKAVAESKLNAIELLLHYGSSLDVEDALGRTPLMVAIENKHQDAVHQLRNTGVALSGVGWQVRPDVMGVLEVHWYKSIYVPQYSQHLLEMYWILRYRGWRTRPKRGVLPRNLALRILEEARYWLKVKSSKSCNEEYNEERANSNKPYVLSTTLQVTTQYVVREVVIKTCSTIRGGQSTSIRGHMRVQIPGSRLQSRKQTANGWISIAKTASSAAISMPAKRAGLTVPYSGSATLRCRAIGLTR
ncbi:hypothetical protein MMC14_010732 [Varicellaria rhodocarpa]|nr:hypothetical protein [Varicellaria rhodocarpa]